MPVKRKPQSLSALCLQAVCRVMVQQWINALGTNHSISDENFLRGRLDSIPSTLKEEIFNGMVEYHVQRILLKIHLNDLDCFPSITTLISSILSPGLHKLNLQCLGDLIQVTLLDVQNFEDMLFHEIPCLHNLIEIDLGKCWSKRYSGLPICTDKILQVIGSTCFQLKTLDISYNHKVTDKGLQYIVPSEEGGGCIKLSKVNLFGCHVTNEGVTVLLKGLPELRFLGYIETLQSLRLLNNQTLLESFPEEPQIQQVNLLHINNLGRVGYGRGANLQCDSTAVDIISKFCPRVKGLNIRVDDSLVFYLSALTHIKSLTLCFNILTPSSPGFNTVKYLQHFGAQLVKLSIFCDALGSRFIKVIGDECNNLTILNLTSKKFINDRELTISDKNNCVLTDLEKFNLKVSNREPYDCQIPSNILNYVLRKSCVLKEVILSMRNTLFNYKYIQDLFSSVDTSKIKSILIEMPFENSILPPLKLTYKTIEALMGRCPELENLGQLSMWDVWDDDIEKLKQNLILTNNALNLT